MRFMPAALFCLVCAVTAAAGEQQKTPFEILLAAEAAGDTADSLHYTWLWETRGSQGAGVFYDESKTILQDGKKIQTSKSITERFTGMPETHRKIFYRDGWYYFDNYQGNGTRVKYPAEPEEEEPGSQFAGGFFHISFGPEMIASQQQIGARLLFTMDPEAVNAFWDSIGMGLKLVSGTVEAEIGPDGCIRKITGSGTYENISSLDRFIEYKGVLENLQWGGVSIRFPADLDSYTEIANPD